MKLISRYSNKVVLVYDDDEAGIKASMKNCETMLRAGLNINCVRLPQGKDPDSLARRKRADFGMAE